MAQAHCLALHFEVPPISQGARTKIAILVDDPGTVISVVRAVYRLPGCVQLRNQLLERLADPPQRRDTLFVQFPDNPVVGLGSPAHQITIGQADLKVGLYQTARLKVGLDQTAP